MTFVHLLVIFIGILFQFNNSLKKASIPIKLLLSFNIWGFFVFLNYLDIIFDFFIPALAYFIFIIYYILRINVEKINVLLSPASVILILVVYWLNYFGTSFTFYSTLAVTIISLWLYFSKYETYRHYFELTVYIWTCSFFLISIVVNQNLKPYDFFNSFSVGSLTVYGVLMLFNIFFMLPLYSSQSKLHDFVILKNRR